MPDEALKALLADENNWKMAAVPRPDKNYGSIAPAIEGLRRLYEATDVAKRGLTDFASRAYNHMPEVIHELEAGAANSPTGKVGHYLKKLRHEMHAGNNPPKIWQDMGAAKDGGTQYAKSLIDKMARAWLETMEP